MGLLARRSGRASNPLDPRELGSLACTVAVLFVPWLSRPADPVRALAWLTLSAPVLGCLAAGTRGRLLGAHLILPGACMFVLVLQDAASPATLPTPLFAAAALTGLHFFGFGWGCLFPGARPSSAAAMALGVAVLAGLPSWGGWVRAPWSPAVAARLLDLSPVVLTQECAGVDWMRHAAVYDPVGTHSIGPDLRSPWRGALAGPATLLVGCLLAAIARRSRGPGAPTNDPRESSWHCASSSAPSPNT